MGILEMGKGATGENDENLFTVKPEKPNNPVCGQIGDKIDATEGF